MTMTATRTTTENLYARLINLRNEAGALLYERLQLAHRVLDDHAWVMSPSGGGGSQGQALDRIEADAFGDLCGAISLSQMLVILHHVPDQQTWKQHKYSLRRLSALARDRERAGRQEKEGATRGGRHAEAEAEPGQSGAAAAGQDEEMAALRTENADLRRQVKRLGRDNRRLRAAFKKLVAVVGPEMETAGSA